MTQLRAEAEADALITRERDAAQSAARQGKTRAITTSRTTTSRTTTSRTTTVTDTRIVDEPLVEQQQATSRNLLLVTLGSMLLVGIVSLIGFLYLAGAAPVPTPTQAAAVPTPTPAAATQTASVPAQTPTPTPTTQIVITPSPSPTATATPTVPTEVATLDDFLNSLGVDETTRAEIDGWTMPDPPSDWNEPGATLDPAGADILGVVWMEASLGQGFLSRLPPCDKLCGSPTRAPGDYYAYIGVMRGPIVGGEDTNFEVGVTWQVPPSAGGFGQPFDRGPTDFLSGANGAYSVRFPPPSSGLGDLLFRLVHKQGDLFLSQDASGAFAVVRGSVIGVFIPDAEWDGITDYRIYTFYQTAKPAAAVSDTFPQLPGPMSTFDPTTIHKASLP